MKKFLVILFLSAFAIPGIAQVLQLKTPSLGDVWPAYSTQRIEWTSTDIDNILIEASYNAGKTWDTIVQSYPSSAQYFPWLVPNKVSDSCYIRISDVLNAGTTSSNRNKPFKIPAPSIYLDTLPANGISKTVLPITWVSSGIKLVSIFASFNNKASFIKIADSLNAMSFYYNWIVPDSSGKSCFIRVVSLIDSTVVDTSKSSVLINQLVNGSGNKFKGGPFDGHAVSNNLQKQITLLTPNKKDSLFGSSLYTITWKQNNIDRINLKFSADNGATWQSIVKEYPASSCKYEWTVPNIPTGLALVKIEDQSDTSYFDTSDSNFVIRKKLLKINQPDASSLVYKQTALPISWTSGGISLLKAYTLVVADLKLLMDSIPANYESINKIISAAASDSFKIVLADWSDSTTRDTSALLVAKNLPVIDKHKFYGGAFDGHTVSSNGKKSLVILSPKGGESYSVLSKYDIKWKSENLERIRIDFSADSGKTWSKIDSGISTSSNAYSWKTPNTASNKCLIRIRNEFDSTLESRSDSVFNISAKKIINNTDSLNWVRGTAKSIEWIALGIETVRLSFKATANQSWKIIGDSITASNETYNWVVPNNLNDSIWIRIADYSDTNVKAEAVYVGKLQNLKSSFSATKYHGGSFDGHTQRSNINKLIVKRPYENEILTGGATYTIKWTTLNFEDSVLLQYSIDSGATWVSITRTMATLGVYDWKIPLSFSVTGTANTSFSVNPKINKPYTVVTTNINSNKCLIRALNISDGNSLIGITTKPFTILTTAAPNKNDLTFPVIKDTIYAQSLSIKLKASNSKNLPVKYSVISGQANLVNDTLLINKPGSITVAAVTPGDLTHIASDTIFQQFCIYPLSPSITSAGTSFTCSGDSNILKSSSTINNQWYLDSTKIVGATDSIFKVKAAGKYRLATSIDGCYSALSESVSVSFSDLTIPVITYSRPLTFVTGDSTVLSSSIATGNQWMLNGNVIANEVAQNLIVKSSGIYTVKLINSSGCAATSLPVTVNANLFIATTPLISNTRPLIFCEGDSTILFSSILFGNKWYLDAVLTGDTTQSIIVKKSGSYAVLNNTKQSISVQVSVNPMPAQPVIINTKPLSFLVGDSTELKSTALTDNQWLLNKNQITGAVSQNLIVKQSGVYSVQVVNSFGCGLVSNELVVQVDSIPLPTISNQRPIAFCFGDSTILVSSSTKGNQWFKDGIIINGAIANSLIVKDSGSYTVTNIVNGYTVRSLPISILVYPIPAKPIITSNLVKVLLSSSDKGNQWYFDTSTAIIGETNAIYKPAVNGYYSVRVSLNGCISAFSEPFNYQDRASASASMDSVVSVFPNPAHNTFTITFNTAYSDKVKVEMVDFNGKLAVLKADIKDKDQIDISTLTPGIYTVTIYDGFGKLISSFKIMKL